MVSDRVESRKVNFLHSRFANKQEERSPSHLKGTVLVSTRRPGMG